MASVRQQTTRDAKRRGADCTPRRGLRLQLEKVFRWMATTSWFLLGLVALLVGASLILSFQTGAWHWFQRSGALMVATGALMSTRRPLTFFLDNLIDERECRRPPQTELRARMDSREIHSCLCGLSLVAIGTLVWAYGDLVGYLIR